MTDATAIIQTARAVEGAVPLLSLVVPCHNERDNVRLFLEEATRVFGPREDVAFEVVFVDDGSTDGTLDELRAIVADNLQGPRGIRVISFSRNFGKESALYAGMQASKGDYVCLIDADLQQDPAVALEMYDYLAEHRDYDVVAAYQANRREGKILSWLKRRFYKIINATSDEIDLPENASDFRVFTRQVADALLAMPERFRFTKGLFAWVGFNTHVMPYEVKPRHSGESNWSTKSLFKYAFMGITSFSTWPLKVLRYGGAILSFVSALYLLYVIIVDYFILGVGVPGYPTLVCLILLFGGFQLLALGIIGDYVARGYIEGKHRPLYIVKEDFSS